MAKSKKKPFDREEYKGFVILLQTFDWDDQYQVLKDGKEVYKCDNRSDAIQFIDAKVVADQIRAGKVTATQAILNILNK